MTRVATNDCTRVSFATYRALEKGGLVTRDTSTSLWTGGQKITGTEQGQQALAQPRPRAALATAVATPPKTTLAQGVHR
ncbi:hypothetical protein [Streptomyces caeruleatus]|uniref:Uncharacterized protein n=1 Tax=Streptomyces caeruleatus TaxID=661399 RepID=A0A124IA57_9ACTN|nr:hypothetical protein [Streptomyces caeruleatus]KUO04626.1 hypothetical protein AQJ67_10520 [Streptomyces caeruleatus]